MTKQNNNITENSTYRKTGRKNLYFGGVIVVFIAISPFLLYLYKSFPDDSKVWETSWFKLDTGFASWYAYAWYLTGKIVPLYLLLLWFFTSKHWWHWIILAPISIFSFQLWGLINESGGYDELEIYYVLPLMMILVPSVYLIRAKLFSKIREKDLKLFEEELAERKSIFGQIKDLFQ